MRALDETETVAALKTAGLALGLGTREVERTIASGINAGLGRSRPMTIQPDGLS